MKSPWAWLVNLVGGVFRRGQDPLQQQRYALPYGVSGINLTYDEMLSVSAVWACMDIVARAIGQCRWNIYQPLGPGRRKLLSDDRLNWILNTRPNPDMTAIGFREAMIFQAMPSGNAYAEIVPDGGGRVAELWPLPSDRITPRRDPATWELYYDYTQPSGEHLRLTPRQVFHVRGPGLFGLMGENVIARAAKTLGVAAAQERHAAAYFGQGANPGGVLKYPGQLSKDRYDRLKEDWAERKKGPENAHKPMILEEGMTWEASTADAVKSQLVESRKFSVEEIARWFGVPLHKIQHLEHATFGNIEHQSIEFVTDAVVPWCRRLEQEADYKCFRQDRGPWKYTCLDTTPLLMGDAKSRAEAHAVWRQNGIMSANEIREREGMNDAGADGDVLLVQSNLTTVENILNPPAKPAPAALPPGDGAAPAPALDPAVPDEAALVARQALELMIVGSLDRCARVLANRRTDLQRGKVAPEAAALLLDAERTKQVERVASELEPAAPLAARAIGRALEPGELQRAVELVFAGEAPAAVAAKALPASCPRPG